MGLWDVVGQSGFRNRQEDLARAERLEQLRVDGVRQSAERMMKEVEERVDRLSLVCRAMWSLVEECTSLTEEDLVARVREIDLQDGVEDGKITRPPRQCPGCGAGVSRKFSKCLYCGYVLGSDEPFDAV